ncbi:MAG: FMN-binding negative transcriptional regulator [Xanthomonadaceae bacterium]|nr:FMN-binding negative transcriptional regulator [Xanthomonadaceae bacterium]
MKYPGPTFREDRDEVLHAAIREWQFGLLVTRNDEGFATSHLPWALDARRCQHGVIVGHLAGYNPQCKVPPGGTEALVVFQGPHAYVSPSWYPGKREDPRQVPTWDYLAVEARGTLTAFDDDARLLDLLTRLTERNESGREHRWRIDDAPDEYIREQMRHVVGIELHIEQLIGRYKLSQNRDAADREGARAGLAAAPTERERAVAKAIAEVQRDKRER